jgi:hypothetical protein
MEALRKSLLPATLFERTFGIDSSASLLPSNQTKNGGGDKGGNRSTSWAKIVKSGN